MDLFILVALALNAALPLGQVAGPPGAVQVMQRHKAVLHIGPGPHLLGTAEQNAHLAGTDFREQLLFPHLGIGLMDKRDLFGGHPLGDELLPDVLIHRKGRFRLRQRHRIFQGVQGRIVQRLCHFSCGACLGCGNIAEYELGQLIRLPIPPDLHDIVHTLIDLGSRLIRQQRVDDPLVQPQLAAIAGNLEHIVLPGVNAPAVYLGRPLGEGLYHRFLVFGGLGHDVVVFHLRGRKMELVGGLDVRDLFEQVHQFRQIEKLGEAGPGPVAGPFRGKLQSGHCLPEAAGPAVKVRHAQLLKPVILEIPLHGVKLRHAVGNRRAGGKDNAPAAGDLVHIAALGKHIAGFLRVRSGEARHIPHLGIEEQVFIVVRLVHKEPVHAELFKSYHIILAAFRLQLFQPGLQGFLCPLQLFHREAFPAAGLHLGDALGDFPYLFP